MPIAMKSVTGEFTKFLEHIVENTRVLTGDTLSETEQEKEIRACLEKGHFGFVAQGIFDENGVLQKTELLARLAGKEGVLFPDSFLPITESIGYKTVFDYLVIEKAFEGIARAATTGISYAINVNPSTFENAGYFLSRVDMLQKRYGVQPEQVIFEILESEPIHYYEGFNPILSELRKRGYKIAVDDFHPVGNHNLFCVDHLSEIDTVKFDGVYMHELYIHREKQSVIEELFDTLRNIIQKHPDIDIVIEKIENEEMFLFFRDIFVRSGIERVCYQGYYFDRGSAF